MPLDRYEDADDRQRELDYYNGPVHQTYLNHLQTCLRIPTEHEMHRERESEIANHNARMTAAEKIYS